MTPQSAAVLRSRQKHDPTRERYNAYMRKWTNAHPEKKLFWDARNRAERTGLPFNITEDDISIPTICPVLGIPIFVTTGQRGNNSPSIDQIEPKAGYTKGNVRIISWRANRLKSDATLEELRLIVRDAETNRKGGTG